MIEKVAAKPRNVRMFFLKIGTIPFIYSVENLVNKSPRNPRKFLVFINGVSKNFFQKHCFSVVYLLVHLSKLNYLEVYFEIFVNQLHANQLLIVKLPYFFQFT